MRRRASAGRGAIPALLINMLFRPEWPILAIILLALNRIFGLPIAFMWMALGIWVVWSAAVTAFVSWAASCSDANPTPGGQRTSERLRAKAEKERKESTYGNTDY